MKYLANVRRHAFFALGLAVVGHSATRAQITCTSVGYGGGDMKFTPKVMPPDNTTSSAGQKIVPYAVNFGGWVRAAIPASGTTSISPQTDYQAQSATGGAWHDCKPGGRCDNLDRNFGFANVTPYVFPTHGWQEPEVVIARGCSHVRSPFADSLALFFESALLSVPGLGSARP